MNEEKRLKRELQLREDEVMSIKEKLSELEKKVNNNKNNIEHCASGTKVNTNELRIESLEAEVKDLRPFDNRDDIEKANRKWLKVYNQLILRYERLESVLKEVLNIHKDPSPVGDLHKEYKILYERLGAGGNPEIESDPIIRLPPKSRKRYKLIPDEPTTDAFPSLSKVWCEEQQDYVLSCDGCNTYEECYTKEGIKKDAPAEIPISAILHIEKLKEKELIAEFITMLEMIGDEDDLYKTKQYWQKRLEEKEK